MRLLTLALLGMSLLAQPAKDRTVVVISLDGFPAYAFDDPRLPAPTLRRLIREGAWARSMTPVNPTVTWPNHTSMVTGVTPAKHGVLYNGLPILEAARLRIEPWAPKSELVLSPTVYDVAHRAGLSTAEVNWVAVTKPGTITWSFGEVPDPDAVIPREMVAAGILTDDEVRSARKGNIAWRDQVWTQAAVHIIEKHKPNLLLYHLLTLDSVHHTYGPLTVAGLATISKLDFHVREILDALQRAGRLEKSTVFVVSDHGFKAVKKVIRPNLAAPEAISFSEGGTAMVYLKNPADLEQVKAKFAATEGVDRVILPDEFAALGLPTPKQSRRAPDLVVSAKDGYAFSLADSGSVVADQAGRVTGSHGYLSTDPDMGSIFIAWGAGIKPSSVVERVRAIDVAPTVASLLGLTMSDIEGRKLAEILR